MKYIRTFESMNEIIPIPKESKNDFLIYYKIHSDKSIEKLNVALDKLNIKDEVYKYYTFMETLMKKVLKTDVVYLCIDTTYIHQILNTVDEIKEEFYGKFDDFIFGGDIYVEDYEVDSKKYNL